MSVMLSLLSFVMSSDSPPLPANPLEHYAIFVVLRCLQAGAFQPFFRAHAHLDTKRREPYLLPEENANIIRAAIRARYTFLPYWYTLFFTSETDGAAVMRPLWVEFPKERATFGIDDNFMIGECSTQCHIWH